MRRRSLRPVSTSTAIAWRRVRTASALVVAVVATGGCQKPLFPPDTPRTPFELHDRLRDRYRPTEEPDVFGKPQPALRARLGRQDD